MTKNVELFVDQGCDFNYILSITNKNNNTGTNVAHTTFNGYLKSSYYTDKIKSTVTISKLDIANGVINIAMNANTTANLTPDRYFLDVFSYDQNNISNNVLKGIVYIAPSSTVILANSNTIFINSNTTGYYV